MGVTGGQAVLHGMEMLDRGGSIGIRAGACLWNWRMGKHGERSGGK